MLAFLLEICEASFAIYSEPSNCDVWWVSGTLYKGVTNSLNSSSDNPVVKRGFLFDLSLFPILRALGIKKVPDCLGEMPITYD